MFYLFPLIKTPCMYSTVLKIRQSVTACGNFSAGRFRTSSRHSLKIYIYTYIRTHCGPIILRITIWLLIFQYKIDKNVIWTTPFCHSSSLCQRATGLLLIRMSFQCSNWMPVEAGPRRIFPINSSSVLLASSFFTAKMMLVWCRIPTGM